MRGIWSFSLEAEAEHSVPVNLLVYSSREESGEPVFGIRFGVLPQILTGIQKGSDMAGCACAFSGETCPGQLKIVCQGRRVTGRKSAGLCWRRFLGG